MAKSMWDIIAKANGKKTGDELIAERDAIELAELNDLMDKHNFTMKAAKQYRKTMRKEAKKHD